MLGDAAVKVQIRFEVTASSPNADDLFALTEALMDQLLDLGTIDPSTDVDAGIGRVGLEFLVEASDVEDAGRQALATVKAAFAGVGVDGPERARVWVPADVVSQITRTEQTVLAPA
jgi:hypothetical protein